MYSVEPDENAQSQIAALPGPACAAWREVVLVLELVPWNGRPINDANPDAAVRQMVFGPGAYGLATYLILERDQRVDVLEVTWVG